MTEAPLDVGAAARLSSAFHLRDVVCVSLEAKQVAAEQPPADFSLEWDAPPTQVYWELVERSLKVVLPLNLFVRATGEGKGAKKVPLAEIGIVLRLEYEAAEGATWKEEDLPHYVGITSYLHAWPYFRADVQWLTAKLGYPALVLPVILSGHAANRVSVTRLREVAAARGAAPARTRTKKKAAAGAGRARR